MWICTAGAKPTSENSSHNCPPGSMYTMETAHFPRVTFYTSTT